MNTLLNKLYHDYKTGYVGATKLYHKVKQIDNTITLKQVKEFYKSQPDIQRFQTQKKQFKNFRIVSTNPNSWQIDLAFWYTKPILTAVNINSRIGYAKLLTSKAQKYVIQVLTDFIKKYKVNIITSDNGSEFMNNKVQSFFRKNDITHYNNEPGEHNTLGKIERFNRTIKQHLMKISTNITHSGASRSHGTWIKILQDVIDNYNSSYHSSINSSPNEMEGEVIKSDIYHNQQLMEQVEDNFKEGDTVVYKLTKKTFQKEGANWSKAIYEVVGMDGYKIEIRSKNNKILYKNHNELKLVKGKLTNDIVNNNDIKEVDKILSHKKLKNGKHKYEIKWKDGDITWEPQNNLRLINKNKMSKLETVYFKNIEKI